MSHRIVGTDRVLDHRRGFSGLPTADSKLQTTKNSRATLVAQVALEGTFHLLAGGSGNSPASASFDRERR
jgi:hypothetical protein